MKVGFLTTIKHHQMFYNPIVILVWFLFSPCYLSSFSFLSPHSPLSPSPFPFLLLLFLFLPPPHSSDEENDLTMSHVCFPILSSVLGYLSNGGTQGDTMIMILCPCLLYVTMCLHIYNKI